MLKYVERKGEDVSLERTQGGGRGLGVTPALLGVCRQTGLHPGLGTALTRMHREDTTRWGAGVGT